VTNYSKEKELLLVGTVHRDPDGAARLRRLLDKERPTTVAVEVSPYGIFYRRRNGRLLRRRLIREVRRLAETMKVSWWEWGQIQAIQAQINVPFEYRGALTYCRQRGAALSCLDSSHWSEHWINLQWQQLLSRDNLAILLEQIPENLRQEVKRGYQFAESLLRHRSQFLVSTLSRSWSADPRWQQRESELAKALDRLYSQLPRGRLAYVGGWQHLLGPHAGGTIYERFEHLQPRRILLNKGTAAA
jgi:hypothetical protein